MFNTNVGGFGFNFVNKSPRILRRPTLNKVNDSSFRDEPKDTPQSTKEVTFGKKVKIKLNKLRQNEVTGKVKLASNTELKT